MRPEDQNNNTEGINFLGMPTSAPTIIKVIGVGGGGDNAVNHMYNEGIHDVTYVVVNTDKKALDDSPVPNKLQLGEGLGAGNKPDVARRMAEESREEIKRMLNDGTKMVFITAGMGGGTGTGASPVIAQCARELGILTVGIVTIPFRFEGNRKIDKALDGVEELSKYVDALLVINNERLRTIYPELTVLTAFAKADDTLTIAARSIADIINMHGIINMDFRDVTTVLKDGGVAVMSTGYAEGENRVTKAIEEALRSPLLGKTDIYNSRRVLLNIYISRNAGENELSMAEMGEVHSFMSRFKTDPEEFKFGLGIDDELGSKVKITILATGFGLSTVPGYSEEKDRRDALKEEKAHDDQAERDKKERRDNVYEGTEGVSSRPRPKVYVLRPEDMDNDDLISRLEASNTKRRTKDERDMLDMESRKAAQQIVQPESDDAQRFEGSGLEMGGVL